MTAALEIRVISEACASKCRSAEEPWLRDDTLDDRGHLLGSPTHMSPTCTPESDAHTFRENFLRKYFQNAAAVGLPQCKPWFEMNHSCLHHAARVVFFTSLAILQDARIPSSHCLNEAESQSRRKPLHR